MESKFKKVPDFEALLKLHCDGINEIAKEKGCCMDYIGQYEGDGFIDDKFIYIMFSRRPLSSDGTKSV